MALDIAIITNLRERKGLYRDSQVLAETLQGHNLTVIDFRDEPQGTHDLVIFLEVVKEQFLGKRNWWVVNPDWSKDEFLQYMDAFEYVLCKTRDTERIFKPLVDRTVYTGFTCEDKYDPEIKREKVFFHAFRGSTAKGTTAIHEASQIEPFSRILAYNMTDEVLKKSQNKCLFHLYPSEYEGWGHALHEGLSVGAVVVSTDIPPMNEMEGVAYLIPPVTTGKLCLATTGAVNARGVLDAVEWCQGLSDAKITAYSEDARASFLREQEHFHKTIGELVSSPSTYVIPPPKLPTIPGRESVAVILATYGDRDQWDKIARKAMKSICEQSRPPDEFIRVHGKTLREARNEGVRQARSTWCLFIDADDEYDIYYIDSMFAAKGDLRYPKMEILDGEKVRIPAMYGTLLDGNYICIGAMFRRDYFLRVGGFLDEEIYEDWSLWLRMEKAGAKIGASHAIYKINFNPNGRNQQAANLPRWAVEIPKRAEKWATYAQELVPVEAEVEVVR